jgi:hypothetical protein
MTWEILLGAAAHALKSLRPDGVVMIVEPFANDKIEDNLNPIGRLFYAASSMSCVPASLAMSSVHWEHKLERQK